MAHVILALLVLFTTCQANRPPGDRSHYVFRGDSRSPEQIRAAGGLFPLSSTNWDSPGTYSLLYHAEGSTRSGGYVSTSASFGQAAGNFAGAGSWVYRIHLTDNMISVNEALTTSPYPEQREMAALGGGPMECYPGLVAAASLTERYETQFERLFTPNPDYHDEGYDGATVQTSADADVAVLAASDPGTVLGDLQNAAVRFMNGHGETTKTTRFRGAVVLLAACSSLRQFRSRGPIKREAKEKTVALTPGLKAMCSIISPRLAPWQYGGKQNHGCPFSCHSDFTSKTPYPPQCEETFGTEIFCSHENDDWVCLSQRRAPRFVDQKLKSCTKSRAFDCLNTENCVGTEQWCSDGYNSTRATWSTVSREQCFRRRGRKDPNAVCSTIESLEVGFSVARDKDGSNDAIIFSVGRHLMLLAEKPKDGDSVVKDVDLGEAFGSKTVSLAHVDRIRLLDKPIGDPSGANDWYLGGLNLTAKCHGSSEVIAITKYSSLQEKMVHGPGFEIEEVWALDIKPGDWQPIR
ncbi:putative enterotoxin [Ophiocordyceps camponoti-rufipedis]|uniref:Putative enterotoxin n=1 Tax=Ophiocordyceps camponoti-rufipedis TaxID=2004952 RepID=A0A2C5YYF2_9HYPO|nr:putative enterotoxin [Ophiocordyceps camponoti-rufipedis]